MLGVRLDAELERRLAALAKKTKRSKSYLAKVALELYIEQEETREYERRETLARWEHYQETGETLSEKAIEAWLDTWGSDQEQPCPAK